jgi:endonuclease/exonuclease/phosphatase family metal-dependent hydrolase
VETYNVGLAHGFVSHAAARIAPLVAALQESPADLLCLQEVWTRADRHAFQAALAGTFTYSWHTPVQQSATSSPACGVTDLFGRDRFVSCLQGNCGRLDGDQQTDCVVDECGHTLERLKQENPNCANALMAQVGSSAPAALWAVLRPWGTASLYAYGGSDGLMLFSKVPLLEPGTVDLSSVSTLNRRRALTATVSLGDEDVAVGCTHLAADLTETAPYPGPFASWADENRAQVELLLELDQKGSEPRIWLGDFNCSFADLAREVGGEFEESCEQFSAVGLEDVASSAAPRCTFCADNRLADTTRSTRIDHVFVRDLEASEVARVAERAWTFQPIGDAPVLLPLSDHYAVRARISLREDENPSFRLSDG